MIQANRVDVVVEMRGGVTVAVYSPKEGVCVVLVDWDEFRENGCPGVLFPVESVLGMPPDTKALVQLALNATSAYDAESSLE